MPFLKNAWYVAAWPEEIGRALLPRQITGEHVVLFRQESGAAICLQDSCPHRFAPLSMGTLKGDRIECKYHGLQFDRLGQCVLNPHPPGSVPANMVTRAYPLVERHGLIWVWMGEPAQAAADRIPDLAYLRDETEFRTVRNYFHLPYGVDLMFDNLMDLSHADFLHKGLISEGFGEKTKPTMTTTDEGDTVRVSWVLRDALPSPTFAKVWKFGPLTDHYRETHFAPPGILKVDLAAVDAGLPRDEGVRLIVTRCVTPETEKTIHEFTLRSRNFALTDAAVDRHFLEQQRAVIVDEDGWMLAAIQRRMDEADLSSLNPVLFNVDTGAIRVRRVMDRLIAAERYRSDGLSRLWPQLHRGTSE
jgi:phenylpropionate dioxygenase-like ring-hydroxylating dioxygenase large terminal subunit